MSNAARGYKALHMSSSRIKSMRQVAQRASLLLFSVEKNWNMPPDLEYYLNESQSKGTRATYDIKLPSQRMLDGDVM